MLGITKSLDISSICDYQSARLTRAIDMQRLTMQLCCILFPKKLLQETGFRIKKQLEPKLSVLEMQRIS